MIPLNADLSLLSLSNKLCLDEVDNQMTIPVDCQNGIVAITECYDRLCWQGQLQLALHITDNCIRIQIIKARYLQVPVDEGYTMFVEARIAPKYSPNTNTYQLRTKSVPDCTAPVFNEKFSFEISHISYNDRLYIELYLNQSKFGYKNAIFLGGMSFNIRRLKQKSIESLKLLLTDSQDNHSMNLFKESTTQDLDLSKTNFKCSKSEHFSISLPSLEVMNQDFPKSQWYYLLGQNSCYCRHMSVSTIPRFSKLDTHEEISSIGSFKSGSNSIPSTITNVMIKSESFSTLSSLNLNDNRNLPSLTGFIRKKITIPRSDSGYGFTLTCQMVKFDFQQFASTPITSSSHKDSSNIEQCSYLPTHRCFRIHSVQKDSPADEVGLPVGAYLLGIGNTPLNCTLTLKDVVECMSKAAESHPNKAIILNICLPDCSRELKSYNLSRQSSNEELNSLVSSDLQTQTKNTTYTGINKNDNNNNNNKHISQPNDFSYHLPSDNCINTVSTTTTTTVNHSITDSFITSNINNSCLPQTVTTTAGSVMLCEECCIDESILHNDNETNNKNGNGSITRRTRILTLAPPILNLKWEDVCLDEANRQWAIEALIIKLINISNNLTYGINAYRTGLQKIANLHPNDLNSLFYNIVEVASQTCKLKQNLQNGCLPYAMSNHTSSPPTSGPLIKTGVLNNKNKLKPTLSSSGSTQSESFKTDSYTKYNDRITTGGGRGLHKRFSFLFKLRKSSASGQQSSPINRENNKPANNHDNTNFRASIMSENFTNNFVGEQPNYQNTVQRNQMKESLHNLPSCRPSSPHSSSSIPPVHGHLDNPGTIVELTLNNLLNQCIDYTNVYPDRLKYFYELRKQYPHLRLFLKNQAMEPGVPILSLFLTLPSEIPRCLLNGLKNIEKFTSDQHKDRPALEKCIKALSDALTCQLFSNTPNNDKLDVNNFVLKDMSYLSNTQSVENNYQSLSYTPSTSYIHNDDNSKPTISTPSVECENSSVNPQETFNVQENIELAKLMKYILPPLFPYPNELLTFNPSEWSSINHYIIYKSYLICTLCSKQYPDLIVEDTSYRGIRLFIK
uniref:C2 domain-containing protein n=1 Tax=Schistosoma mansoni TaxID=6183 RepID=A0A3Q0KKP8_SCHMA